MSESNDVKRVTVEVTDKFTLHFIEVRGRYHVWHDVRHPSRPWRWAMIEKPDDGVGVQAHGGSTTRTGAVEAAKTHDDDYRALSAALV